MPNARVSPSPAGPSGPKLAATTAYLLALPLLQLWLSGDWGWVEGWLFAAWFVGLSGTTIAWLRRNDPALLAERYRRPGSGGQSRGDAVVVGPLLVGFLAWFFLPPLDARRFGWTPRLPVALEAVGGVLLVGAAFFLFRSFTDNTYLSPLVRVQAERAHRVVSTGVYGVVRHPMYLGASLMFIGGPLLLGSAAGLVAGAALIALLVGRIVAEERVLAAALEGYDDYRRRVRYRLVPRVW